MGDFLLSGVGNKMLNLYQRLKDTQTQPDTLKNLLSLTTC